MLQQIVLRRLIDHTGSIDLGMLAESLMFYQKTVLVCDRGSLGAFTQSIGIHNVIRLIDDFGLHLSYIPSITSTLSKSLGPLRFHDFGQIQLVTKSGKPFRAQEDAIQALERALGNDLDTRKAYLKLVDRLAFPRHPKRGDKFDIGKAAKIDLSDPKMASDLARIVLSHLLPKEAIRPDFHFDLIETNDGLLVNTNLDYQSLNSIYHNYISPKHSSLSNEYLLNMIYDAHVDAYMAANYMSGYFSNPISSSIMNWRFNELIRRSEADLGDITLFQETLLTEGRSVRELINSGAKPFVEILPVLEKAKKFRKWLDGISPDLNLISEYHREVTRDSWINGLMPKTYRWLGFGAAGLLASTMFSPLVGTAAGVGLGAVDTFLVDKLMKGWRPDQFVQGTLANFVST